jgi:hypothetical protein
MCTNIMTLVGNKDTVQYLVITSLKDKAELVIVFIFSHMIQHLFG